MKLRRFLSALATVAIVGSLALTSTPASAEPGDGTVTGKVTDATTGAGMANVCVVNGPVALRCWSATNADGNYQLTIPGLTSSFSTNLQFLRTGYTTVSRNITLQPNQQLVENIQMTSLTPGVPVAPVNPPAVIGNPPPVTTTPTVTAPVAVPAPTVSVEVRIADFWKRIDALAPTDNVSASDLGGWALNVIERNPKARLSAADFRTSTAGMQAGLDKAGLGPVPAVTPTPVANIEQRIADFWKRIDALAPGDYVSAADLGQWALNVIGRIPRAQLNAADFRVSTASMQGGFDRAGLAP